MARTDYTSVDDYIAAQPAPARPVLERVRATIRKALPGATEEISYQIPVYKLDGVMVLYFAGFKNHYSIYPATARVVGALENELEGLLHSKATIRFPLADAVPTRLITRIAKLRAAEAIELKKAKAAKKAAAKGTVAKTAKPGMRTKPSGDGTRKDSGCRIQTEAAKTGSPEAILSAIGPADILTRRTITMKPSLPIGRLRMNLADIATPAALIDEPGMMRNIARMQERMTALGVRLRPHVKTPKCIEVAQRQVAAGARGITVSTLKEAEEFFAHGFADVLYAVCIPPSKLDRVLALRRRGCALTILVDSLAAAQAIVDKGRTENHAFDVMIEVDTDGHRSGVEPDDSALVDIGGLLHHGGAAVKGVLTHAGSSYDLDTPEALQRLAEQERSGCVRAAANPARRRPAVPGGERRFDADGAVGDAPRRRHRGSRRRLRVLRSGDGEYRRLRAAGHRTVAYWPRSSVISPTRDGSSSTPAGWR